LRMMLRTSRRWSGFQGSGCPSNSLHQAKALGL
jgi:hypothetical protein